MQTARMKGLMLVYALLGWVSAQAAVVQNAGFETGSGASIGFWTQWDNARLEPWAARTGTNGLAMYGWTSGGGVFQDVAAAGVSNYTFSAYGFRDAGFPTQLVVEMKLEFKKTNDTTLATVSKTVNGSASWTQQTVSAVSPQGTEKVRMTLLFGGTAGAGGAYKFDDVSLSSTAATTPTNTHYVAPLGGNIYPYTNWATAARSIQDAVYAAGNGDLVLVTNGTYTLATQIIVDRSITVRGVNGASNTVVDGAYGARCFLVESSNTVLEGLTVTRGRPVAPAYSGIHPGGGGIYAPARAVTIRHCRFVANQSWKRGGGLEIGPDGLVSNSVFLSNVARGAFEEMPALAHVAGGGIYAHTNVVVANCLIASNASHGGSSATMLIGSRGGGILADGASVINCRILANSATASNVNENAGVLSAAGGGASLVGGGQLRQCEVSLNVSWARAWIGSVYPYEQIANGAGIFGDAFWTGRVESCTVTLNRNMTQIGPDNHGDGAGLFAANGIQVANCIIYGNSWIGAVKGMVESNAANWYALSSTFSNTCTTPAPAGNGNLTDDPHFYDAAAGDFRLAAGSSCIDRGVNQGWMTSGKDLAGSNRLYNTTVDIGAYEFGATGGFNLLLNGNLEKRDTWIRGGDLNHEGWAAKNGTNGLAMYGWTGNSGYAYQDVAAGAASSYTFSVWGYKDTNFNAVIQKPEVKLEYFNASWAMLGAITNKISNAPAAWTKFSVTGAKPGGAAYVRVVLVFSGPASGGAFKWDDAQLVAGGVAGAMRAAATDAKVSEPEEQPGETTTEPVPATEPVVTAPVTVIPVVKPVAAAVAPASSGEPAGVTFGGQAGLVVVTSDDLGLENLGMPAVDGNPRTAWKGEAGAGGWWIAVQYPETIRARSVKLQLAKGSLANAQVLYSTDAKTWADLGAALKAGKVDLKYLWVIFPDDGSGAVPVVKEISIKAAK